MQIPDFVRDQVFNKLVRQEDGLITYWRETLEGDGYVVWWPDLDNSEDAHLHTYFYPPDIWG